MSRRAALHRREARITAALPPTLPVPRLLGVHDDGQWVALVLEDVEGRHPATPWRAHELAAVLDALTVLADQPLPPSLVDLPRTDVELAHDLGGFSRLAADPPADLDPWARAHLGALCDLASRAPQALAGDCLVHTDVRADNLLMRSDASVVLVDWPWATRGAPWFDTLAVLVDVHHHDREGAPTGKDPCAQGHDVDSLLAAHAPDVDAADLTAVLAGLAGYFLDVARQPPPVGLPTVRAFQAAEGRSTLAWVRRRLGGPSSVGSSKDMGRPLRRGHGIPPLPRCR